MLDSVHLALHYRCTENQCILALQTSFLVRLSSPMLFLLLQISTGDISNITEKMTQEGNGILTPSCSERNGSTLLSRFKGVLPGVQGWILARALHPIPQSNALCSPLQACITSLPEDGRACLPSGTGPPASLHARLGLPPVPPVRSFPLTQGLLSTITSSIPICVASTPQG